MVKDLLLGDRKDTLYGDDECEQGPNSTRRDKGCVRGHQGLVCEHACVHQRQADDREPPGSLERELLGGNRLWEIDSFVHPFLQ